MRTKKAVLLACLVVAVAAALISVNQLRASCLLLTGSQCNGTCVELTFSISGGSGCTYTIERKPAGGSYSTLSTNATSPFNDCPGSGSFMYRITANCSNCNESNEEGVLTCGN